jgi:hypothetical protein
MHDCACHASFKLKHGAINVNAVNSAAESARTDGQTARRSALQPVPLQRCRHTVMTGVGPFNVTKLQQCLQFRAAFKHPSVCPIYANAAIGEKPQQCPVYDRRTDLAFCYRRQR